MTACPCGSGRPFAQCCRPFITGRAHAPTAEALMRSRYTAYVRRDEPYLLRTWAAQTRPASLDLDDITWLGLEVLASTKGQAADASGTVSFVAHYAGDGIEPGTMRENSRFKRDGEGAWVYVDGDLK